MRRAVSLAVLWLAAAAAATFVAWQGVALVGDHVTDRPPSPLAADTVDDAAGGSTSTTAPPTPTTTAPTAAPATSPPSVPSGGGPGGSGGTGSGSSSGTSGSGTGGSGTSGSGSGAGTTAPTGTTRTYNLIGGDVALRFEPSGVVVLYATPKPGFTVEIGNGHGNGKDVRFDSDDHRSEVEGWWDGGPVDEVREDD